MLMRLTLLSPPDVEPLTAAETRERLNLGSEVSDAVIDSCLTAARQRIDGADGYLGRALITQTWVGRFDQWPTCDKLMIPLPPLQSVTELSYLGDDGTPVVMTEDAYQVVMGPRPYLVPAFGLGWPPVANRADAISLTFIAGYGDDGTDVPEPIRTAIALAAGAISSMTTRRLDISLEREEGIGETRYNASNVSPSITIDQAASNLLSTYRVIRV